MKRTTIMLPSKLKIRALQKANQMGISLAELIRESLETILSHSKEQAINDPLFTDDDIFYDQGPSDLAQNHDRYLYGDK